MAENQIPKLLNQYKPKGGIHQECIIKRHKNSFNPYNRSIAESVVFMIVKMVAVREINNVIEKSTPWGGRLEYFHCSPESRRRQQKGNLVPEGITGPPCQRGT
jgi:hypothetical protein